jgi:hypothetical protein
MPTAANTQVKKWLSFATNLNNGITYYKNLLSTTSYFANNKNEILSQLEECAAELGAIPVSKPEMIANS